MEKFDNVLLVSGSGRNCGKTTLACDIIKKISSGSEIYGLKISPHIHINNDLQQLVAEGESWKIYRETDRFSTKDSSRMLASGASEVYFAECSDGNLPDMLTALKKLFPIDIPVVCESGSFANSYIPGLHVLVRGSVVDKSKRSYVQNLNKANAVIGREGMKKSDFIAGLEYDSYWKTVKKSPVTGV